MVKGMEKPFDSELMYPFINAVTNWITFEGFRLFPNANIINLKKLALGNYWIIQIKIRLAAKE